MNSAGRIGASAEGSTPSWMVRLLARSSLVDDLDLAGDAGADVEALDLGRMPDADGVDGQLGAVAEGDDVAVGREAPAQPVRQGEPLLARAQQDLGRAQRAGRQHDHVRRHHAGLSGAVPAAVLPLEVDAPAALGRLGDVAHLGVGEDLGAVPCRIGQVGERHRVLGADVAAPAAVAAARAGGLRHAGRIDGCGEAHHHRGRDRRLAQRHAGALERLVLGALGRRLVPRRPHPARRPRVAFIDEPVRADLGRPHGIAEHAGVRPQRHAGIDQRPAAQPAADEHVHVLAEAHVVEAGRRAQAQALARQLHLAAQVGEAGRKLARDELAAALQHGHALARARQARGRHAAAIARAHHHHVVVRPQPIERAGEARHAASLGEATRLGQCTARHGWVQLTGNNTAPRR